MPRSPGRGERCPTTVTRLIRGDNYRIASADRSAAALSIFTPYGGTSIRTLAKQFASYIERTFKVAIIPEWRILHIDEERHLRRLLKYLDVDCVLDVGANIGQYGLILRKNVEYDGPLISFEPNPEAFQTLSARASRDAKWMVEPIALGRESGQRTLNVHAASDMSSLHEMEPSFANASSVNAITEQRQVTVTTLASYLSDVGTTSTFRRPFLKLDTQGSDMDVILGAGSRIREFVGIQSEISFRAIYKNTSGYVEHIRLIEQQGFRLSRITPIHDAYFPLLIEMNAIFIRSDLC